MESHASDAPLLRPRPRRPFIISGSSTPGQSSTHSSEQHTPPTTNQFLSAYNNEGLEPESPGEGPEKVTKSKSVLNLTSSTLFGIYGPTTFNDNTSTPQTPWGTGAETPARGDGADGSLSSPQSARMRGLPNGDEIARRLHNGTKKDGRPVVQRQKTGGVGKTPAKMVVQNMVLFLFGVAYGGLVSRLHSSRRTPIAVPLETAQDEINYVYLASWGIAGVAMGNFLPFIDGLTDRTRREMAGKSAVGWNDVIRSVGSFAGVAFAIRRLPWETTLQLSLTLSLANPLLWYLLDRTTSGLALSSAIGFVGTGVLLLTNPALIPAPTIHLPTVSSQAANAAATNGTANAFSGAGIAGSSSENIAVATWIASVLFCSCVCFGNIGRLLSSR